MTALLLSFFALTAHAHEPGLSRVSVDGDQISVVLSRADADGAGGLLADAVVTSDGAVCDIGRSNVEPFEEDGVEVSAPLDCPAGEVRTLQAGWLAAMAPGHRLVLEHAGQPTAILDAGNATATVQAKAAAGPVALGFLGLGIEHILTGWDHLVFLAALLLVARSLKEAAGIVSGFTVAHSVTLTAAALGWVTAPASMVEPAIALTILWVGLENLVDPPASRRFVATMILGLVHGFGFAGLLGELGMPAGQTVLAMLSFNAGVELGQLALVVTCLPVLLWLGRSQSWRKYAVPTLSMAIAMMGLVWLVQRVGAA